MAEQYTPPTGLSAETQLEIIEQHFYDEAALFGMARALVDRREAMARCDSLLDAANQILATGKPINVEELEARNNAV